ncbi:addiction module protein [Melioribacteraceae bacterium 4301-Me]|uniref:addiction module protein n=1 Tax=Pyranulibacter aquaticus TaxID=3163344 RepID=UPI00359932CA
MNSKNIIKDILNLSPAEKLYIIEILSQSLNEADEKINKYWKKEVEERYEAYLKGKIKSIPYNDVLKK